MKIHGAFDGDLRIPSGSESLDGDRKQRHVPTGNASTHGTARGCAVHCVWIIAGEVRERRGSEA